MGRVRVFAVVLVLSGCGSTPEQMLGGRDAPGGEDVPAPDILVIGDGDGGGGLDVAGPDLGDAQEVDALPVDGDPPDAGAADAEGGDLATSDAEGADADTSDADTSDAAGPDATVADAGALCTLPLVRALMLPSDSYTGRLAGQSANASTSCTTDIGTGGPEHLFALQVAVPTSVRIRASSQTARLAVAVRRACDDALSELACGRSDRSSDGAASVVVLLDPGDYHVLVDVLAFGVGGDYTLTVDGTTPPPNASCASAVTVTAGARLTAQDASRALGSVSCARQLSGTDGGVTDGGVITVPSHALHYRATVPPSTRLTVAATTQTGRAELLINDGCGASASCLGITQGQGRISYSTGPAAQDVIITVFFPAFGTPPPPPPLFDLSVDMAPLLASTSCAGATPVMAGSTINEDSSLGGSDQRMCTGAPTFSGTLYHTVDVPAGQRLRVTLAPDMTVPFWQATLAILDGCQATSCLASAYWMSSPMVLTWDNNGASTRPVVIVAGRSTNTGTPGGPFTLSIALETPPANVSCTSPTPVAPGMTILGDTTPGSTAMLSCPLLQGGLTRAMYHSITVPPGQALRANVTPLTQSWAPAVMLLDGCTTTSCLAGGASSGATAGLTWANAGATPRDVIIAAGARPQSPGGTFRLDVQLTPVPANASCATPQRVNAGAVITADTGAAAGGVSTCARGSGSLGKHLFYTITVPPLQLLRVSATSQVTEPGIAVIDACGSATCLAGSNMVSQGVSTATWANASSAARDVIVIAGSFSSGRDAGTGGPLTLTFGLDPLPANASCGGAMTLASGVPVAGNAELGATTGLFCSLDPAPSTSALYYAIEVPAGAILDAAVTLIDTTWDPRITIHESCTGSCLGSSGLSIDRRALRFVNTGATRTLILSVWSANGRPGRFTLTATTRTPAPNASCAGAVQVSDGTTLGGQSVLLGTQSLAPLCVTNATGGVLHYRARVPAGQILTARATPTGAWAPLIRVLDGCAASSCLARSTIPSGNTAVVTQANNTGADADLLIAVSSIDNNPGGTFDLGVSIAPLPYRESTIPAVCTDTSTATLLTQISSSESTTAVLLLPFPFRYFGAAAGGISITSNGYAQLWPQATGAPAVSPTAQALPTVSTPNGVVAPFWDDLTPGTARMATSGAAGARQLLVSWDGFRVSSDASILLRFQLKLFETTNVIEMHYCTLASSGSTRATGANAAVGLEDFSGLTGFQHSYRMPALTAGTALRFTPN